MLTTMFPGEIARVARLRGAEKLVNRSMCLVERYPTLKRGRSVDAIIAIHALIGIALSEKQKKAHGPEEIERLSWEIYHDNELRKNERRLSAERNSTLILTAIRDKMNPLLTGERKPKHIHTELAETGITSLDLLESFIDEIPSRADGYRGLIEKIGSICREKGYSEELLPMLQNSIETIGSMELDSIDNVGSQLYMISMSLHKTEKIITMLKSRKLFENPEVTDLRSTLIELYIKRGVITTEGKCDLIRVDSVLESFELFDNELMNTIKEKAEDVGDGILHKIIEAHAKLSDTLRTKRGGELIEGIVKEIKNATTSLKK